MDYNNQDYSTQFSGSAISLADLKDLGDSMNIPEQKPFAEDFSLKESAHTNEEAEKINLDAINEQRNEGKIRKGLTKAIFLCIFGLMAAMMMMIDEYHIAFPIVTGIASLFTVIKSKFFKHINCLVFLVDAVYSAYILYKAVQITDITQSIVSVVIYCTIMLISLIVMFNILFSDNLSVYYDSAKSQKAVR